MKAKRLTVTLTCIFTTVLFTAGLSMGAGKRATFRETFNY